jgi:hypothetical protein
MSKFTRTLIIGAMLAAVHLVGMTAVAHAQATDQRAALRPPSEGQVGEAWRHRQAPPPRQARWVIASLAVLVAALVLAVLAARWTRRRARPRHAT